MRPSAPPRAAREVEAAQFRRLMETTLADDSWLTNNEYPFVPLNAPGMPLPGPNFQRLSQALGDPVIRTTGKGKEKRLVEELPGLRLAYSMALYEPGFTMSVNHAGNNYTCQFISGHRWGNNVADGPRARASVMVVGKMPGSHEARSNLNLTGPSGWKLIEVLEEHGIYDYDNFYITNLLKFPIPESYKGDNPPKPWTTDCLPLLWEEVRLVRPKYVLCLGSEAAKAFLGSSGGINISANKVHDYKVILDHVDPTVPCEECAGVGIINTADKPEPCMACSMTGRRPGEYTYHQFKLMTCLHPAAVCRTPDLQPQFSESVRLFCELLRGRDVGAVETDIERVVCSDEASLEQEVDKLIARTPTGSIIAVDAEWHGEHPWDKGAYLRTIQISDRPKYAMCVELTGEGGSVVFTDKDGKPDIKAAIPHLTRLLKTNEERKVRIAGHFFRADMPQIKWHLGIDLMPEYSAPPEGPDLDGFLLTKTEGGFDTGLAAHAVREADDYKLEVLCTRYTTMPRWDGPMQEWKKAYCMEHKISSEAMEGYGMAPRDRLVPYGMDDVDGTRRLVDVFNGVGNKPGLLDYDKYGLCSRRSFWVGMRASPACAEMEFNGVPVDKPRAIEMSAVYKKQRDALLARLREEIQWPLFNPASAFHVRELLFGVEYSGKIDKKKGGTKSRQSPDGTQIVGYEKTTCNTCHGACKDDDGVKCKRCNGIGKEPIIGPPAVLCNLQPIKTTTKSNKKSWDELVRTGQARLYTPSTDKEVLGILSAQSNIARSIRDIRFLTQLLNTTLRSPKQQKDVEYYEETTYIRAKKPKKCKSCNGGEDPHCDICEGQGVYIPIISKVKRKRRVLYKDAIDETGEKLYDRGLLSYVSPVTGCVHTTLYQTKETGRWSAARPNLQAISKRREDDYKQILGYFDEKENRAKGRYIDYLPAAYTYPLRSIFVAPDGYVLIEADYKAAELCCMAWMSGDERMIEHVRRAQLPEDHPDFYDIHSNVACAAFKLDCPATKDGLKSIGKSALRVAAKNVVFGFAYGRGAEAIQRQCKEEGVSVTLEEAQALIDGLKAMYPRLPIFFDGCRRRVTEQGWICSAGGYFRRVHAHVDDRQIIGELERQFMNFGIQNLVAYAASRACDHLYNYRIEHPEIDYKFLLQIHDAIILAVPYEHVERVYNEVLPECMCKKIPIWPTDLDGFPLENVEKPYYLDIDKEVMFRWSEKIYDDHPKSKHLPSQFVKKRKK